MDVTAAYVQTIDVFPIPELLSNRASILSWRKRYASLQRRSLRGKTTRQGNLLLRPVFDYRKPGPYTDRFWQPFQQEQPRGVPSAAPVRFQLPDRIRPVSDGLSLLEYHSSVRGQVFPLGATSIRLSEFVAPARPISGSELFAFLQGKVLLNSTLTTRQGALGTLKGRVLTDLIPKTLNVGRRSLPYTVVHLETKSPLDRDRDWDDLRVLLSFSESQLLYERLRPSEFENLGFEGQLFLAGPYCAVLSLNKPWAEAKLRRRRCLRSRFASTLELAACQRQLMLSLYPWVMDLIDSQELAKGHPLETVIRALAPEWGYRTLRQLLAVLTFQEKFEVSDDPRAPRWPAWFTALSEAIFPTRATVARGLARLNDLEEATNEEAVETVRAVLAEIRADVSTFSGIAKAGSGST